MDYVKSYKKWIINTFNFLITDYDYSLTYQDEYSMNFESSSCIIFFIIDRNQLFIDIKNKRLNTSEVDIFKIAKLLHPGASLIGYRIEIWNDDEAKEETERLALIIKSFCIEAVIGDSNAWLKLTS